MSAYIVRRLLWLPFILIIVSFITFILGRYGPGDPVELLLGQHANPEAVERIREQRGLNDNIMVQYGRYVKNVVRGEFGESFKYRGRSVADLLKKKMWVSAQLNIAALVISVGLGIPIGLFGRATAGHGLGHPVGVGDAGRPVHTGVPYRAGVVAHIRAETGPVAHPRLGAGCWTLVSFSRRWLWASPGSPSWPA